MLKRYEFAAKMLEIEAYTALTRAHSLMGNDVEVIKNLKLIRKLSSDLCVDILNPSETAIYLAN